MHVLVVKFVHFFQGCLLLC